MLNTQEQSHQHAHCVAEDFGTTSTLSGGTWHQTNVYNGIYYTGHELKADRTRLLLTGGFLFCFFVLMTKEDPFEKTTERHICLALISGVSVLTWMFRRHSLAAPHAWLGADKERRFTVWTWPLFFVSMSNNYKVRNPTRKHHLYDSTIWLYCLTYQESYKLAYKIG